MEHNHLSGVHTCVSIVHRSQSGVADLQVALPTCQTFTHVALPTCQTFTACSCAFCLSCFDRSTPSCLSCFDRSDACLSCFDRSDPSCLSCFDRYPPSNRDRAGNFAHEQRPFPTGDRTSRSGAGADPAALGTRRMAHDEHSGHGRVGFHRRSPFIFHLRKASLHPSIPEMLHPPLAAARSIASTYVSGMDHEQLESLIDRERVLRSLAGGTPMTAWSGWLVDDAVAALQASGENQQTVDYVINLITLSEGWPDWVLPPQPPEWLIEKVTYLLKEFHGPRSWSTKRCSEAARLLVTLAHTVTREAAERIVTLESG